MRFFSSSSSFSSSVFLPLSGILFTQTTKQNAAELFFFLLAEPRLAGNISWYFFINDNDNLILWASRVQLFTWCHLKKKRYLIFQLLSKESKEMSEVWHLPCEINQVFLSFQISRHMPPRQPHLRALISSLKCQHFSFFRYHEGAAENPLSQNNNRFGRPKQNNLLLSLLSSRNSESQWSTRKTTVSVGKQSNTPTSSYSYRASWCQER